MPVTTIHPLYTEWFTVNGEPMATYGWGVESVTTGLPDRKGDNVTSPIMHGSIFREKRFGPRTDTWNIWISDYDPQTGLCPDTEDGRRAQLNANIDYVNGIFNGLTPNGLNNGALKIQKYSLSGTGPSGPTTTVLEAYAEVSSAYSYDDPKQFNYASMSIDITYPDPRWYATDITSVPVTCVSGTSSGAVYLTAGNAPVSNVVLTFECKSGTLTNPKLTNTTLTDYPSVIGYNGTLTAGQSVTIDTSAMTVFKGATNSIQNLYRSGYRQDWMEIYPSVQNTFVLTSDTTTSATCTIAYKTAYL